LNPAVQRAGHSISPASNRKNDLLTIKPGKNAAYPSKAIWARLQHKARLFSWQLRSRAALDKLS
jgi:hypothetical protein